MCKDMLIDNRIGSKDLASIPPLDNISTLCELNSADVCFTGNGPEGDVLVGIEVKSIYDLIGSIKSKRLQHRQVPEMLKDYTELYIAVYGISKLGKNGEIMVRTGRGWTDIGRHWVWVESVFATLKYLGFTVVRYSSKTELAQWLYFLYHWYQKDWDRHKSLSVLSQSSFAEGKRLLLPKDKMSGREFDLARFANLIPGVGYERAVEISRYFPSIKAMVNAEKEEWLEITGVGEVIACQAINLFNSGSERQ